jgi:hypothetical protein
LLTVTLLLARPKRGPAYKQKPPFSLDNLIVCRWR